MNKKRYASIFLMVLLFLSMTGNFSYSVHGQEEEKRPDTTGLISPRIDGFLEVLAPEGFAGEWGDARSESIALTTENGEIGADLFTKVLRDQILIGMKSKTQPSSVRVQIDLDNSGDLSPNDVMAVFHLPGSNALSSYQNSGLGPTTGNNQLGTSAGIDQTKQSPEGLGVQLYLIPQHEWMPLWQYMDKEAPDMETARLTSLIAEGGITSPKDRLPAVQQDSTTHFEMRLDPNTLLDVIMEKDPEYESPYADDTLETKDLNYGVMLEGAERGQVYGYPDAPTLNNNEQLQIESYANYKYKFKVDDSWFMDVGLDNIEVTQSVQFANESLRLVKGKQSLARVYVNNPSTSDLRVQVQLKGIAVDTGSVVQLGTLSQTFDAPSSVDRTVLSDTANFELPQSWVDHKGLLLKAEVSPRGFLDPDTDDNDIYDFYTFEDTYDMNIYYVNVNQAVSNATINQMQTRMTTAYPVDQINWIELDWETIGTFSGDDHDLIAELNTVLGGIALTIIFQILSGDPSPLPVPDQIFGFRSGGGGHSDPTWNNHGVKMAYAGTGGASADPMVAAHEINHNLGPNSWGRHVGLTGSYGCTAGQYGPDQTWQNIYNDHEIHALGWDPARGLISSTTPDFMSYCDAPTWISDYRWEKLIDKLSVSSYSPGDPTSMQLDTLKDDVFSSMIDLDQFNIDAIDNQTSSRLISGRISDQGISVNPSYEVPGVWENVPTNDTNQTPAYYIDLVYRNGSSTAYPIYANLSSNGEAQHKGEDGHIENLKSTSFAFWFPDTTNESSGSSVYYFDIMNSKGELIFRRSGGGYTGDVGIKVPQTITRGQNYEIQWDSSIVSKRTIYYQLQYSPDNKTWHDIGSPTTGSSVNTTFNTYPGTDKGYFRMITTDGFRTLIHYESSTTQMKGLPPRVKILSNQVGSLEDNKLNKDSASPNGGDVTNAALGAEWRMPQTIGSTYSFGVSAFDQEDGKLDKASPLLSASWEILDENGNQVAVMPGDNVKFSLHEAGTYTLKVAVTDSDHMVGTDTFRFEVGSPDYLTANTVNHFRESIGKQAINFTFTQTETDFETNNLPAPLSSTPVFISLLFMMVTYTVRRRKNQLES